MLLVCARQLEGALGRGFRIVAKDERHAVTRGEPDELPRILGRADLLRSAHHDLQMLDQFALLVDEQAHDINEENVPDLEGQLVLCVSRIGWHYHFASFGASEATICSKRGSPRSGSQNGCNFSWP